MPVDTHAGPMRISRWRVLPALLLAASLLAGSPVATAAATYSRQDPETLYQQAKDLTMKGEWARALEIFRRVSESESPQAAGAAFYVAVCLENLSGRDPEAFEAFDDMRRRFPDASLAREALLRQIVLAGVLGFSDLRFREFLVRHLESEDRVVRRQAAVSLGRLGDERAAEGLVELVREGSPEQRMMALEQVPNFDEKVATRLLKEMRRATSDEAMKQEVADFQASLVAERKERRRNERLLTRDVRALMERIKRGGEEWTEEEILTHGLYAVMPTREFVAYVQASKAEKARIYREFWEGVKDPFPETPENEMEREFLRRVDQALKLFGEPWRATRSRYDAKEWLTVNNPYSPWDARGTLLLRYGEPSDIFIVGPNVEEWLYGHLRVDFTVHKYKLNWFRNAIFPGRMSLQDYPEGYVEANFISRPRIEYWPGGGSR